LAILLGVGPFDAGCQGYAVLDAEHIIPQIPESVCTFILMVLRVSSAIKLRCFDRVTLFGAAQSGNR
jgi:hypothetical protein